MNEDKKDEMPNFVMGANTIDLKDIQDVQNEIEELKEDFDTDPELQKDVLENFEAQESDQNLEAIAQAIGVQAQEDLLKVQEVLNQQDTALEALNAQMIVEDRALEALSEEAVEEDELAQELRAALPQPKDDGSYDLDDLQSCIEAILFYSDKPISLKRLIEALELAPEGTSKADYELIEKSMLEAIELLKFHYSDSESSSSRGFELCEIAGGYQFRTKSNKAALLRKLAKVQVQRLSRGAMEALTIIAYKQPCTKDEIDKIRGVDSSHFIRTLLDRNLIDVSARAETPGRPMLYVTTDQFLELFALKDLNALPPLREIEAMVPQLIAEKGAEDPTVVKMRNMVQQMKDESENLDYKPEEDEQILQEIRQKVKEINITTPFLEAQKAAEENGEPMPPLAPTQDQGTLNI